MVAESAERLERHGVDGLLAGEPLGGAFLRELRLDVLLRLAELHALDGVEDLGEESAFLDLGPEALAGRDDLGVGRDLENRLLVDRAGVVDLDEIAVGDRIALLCVLVLRVRGAQALELLLYGLVRDRRVLVGNF